MKSQLDQTASTLRECFDMFMEEHERKESKLIELTAEVDNAKKALHVKSCVIYTIENLIVSSVVCSAGTRPIPQINFAT